MKFSVLSDRNDQVVRLRAAGWSFAFIGDQCGVCRSRARQIVLDETANLIACLPPLERPAWRDNPGRTLPYNVRQLLIRTRMSLNVDND
jgi:hypothetical protein